MDWWILVAIIAGAGIVFALRARSRARRPGAARAVAPAREDKPGSAGAKRAKPPAEAIDSFRGVMLFPQKDCCDAILKLRGTTYPQHAAPTVPVPGCDRASCECRVHQVNGRRHGPRRLTGDRRGDVRFKEDRRRGKDRRSGVDTWKNSS